MKLLEVIQSTFGIMTLNENDEFIAEMANFLADVTELPANVVLWTETQPGELPHTKYRMKVYKDRVHATTFTIGQNPQKVWEGRNRKFTLTGKETSEVMRVLSIYSSLFIQYVDGKLTADQVKYEIKRLNGEIK